jgi:hypothetical protein
MSDLGLDPDPWQRSVLRSSAPRILQLCCRQSGKSTTTSILALHTALFLAQSLVLLLSPSLRQSNELFRKVKSAYVALGRPVPAVQETALTLALQNGSRIVSLPANPETVRGFSGVRLVVIDEAAVVSDELFIAVNPMLAVSRGRLVCLSTPFGKRGWFHEAWESPSSLWERVKVTAWTCPRIAHEFLVEQRELLGDRSFRQEYECSFEETMGQVFSTENIQAAFHTADLPLFGNQP